jgi:hypothetical protein
MKRTITALALIATGYLMGGATAAASDPAQGIVSELRAIRSELLNIRHVMEKLK